MDLFRVVTFYIMTRRHYSPTREGDNVVRLQLMPQVSGNPHCSLYTWQPSRIIAVPTVGRVCLNNAYLPLVFPWTGHSVLASGWLALPGRRSWSHETLLCTSGPSWEHVLGDKRGTCRSRGVEVREEEREGEEKGGERRKRGNGESERAITSVMLCRARRPDWLLQSVNIKCVAYHVAPKVMHLLHICSYMITNMFAQWRVILATPVAAVYTVLTGKTILYTSDALIRNSANIPITDNG